jgi:hypothetical protein
MRRRRQKNLKMALQGYLVITIPSSENILKAPEPYIPINIGYDSV